MSRKPRVERLPPKLPDLASEPRATRRRPAPSLRERAQAAPRRPGAACAAGATSPSAPCGASRTATECARRARPVHGLALATSGRGRVVYGWEGDGRTTAHRRRRAPIDGFTAAAARGAARSPAAAVASRSRPRGRRRCSTLHLASPARPRIRAAMCSTRDDAGPIRSTAAADRIALDRRRRGRHRRRRAARRRRGRRGRRSGCSPLARPDLVVADGPLRRRRVGAGLEVVAFADLDAVAAGGRRRGRGGAVPVVPLRRPATARRLRRLLDLLESLDRPPSSTPSPRVAMTADTPARS